MEEEVEEDAPPPSHREAPSRPATKTKTPSRPATSARLSSPRPVPPPLADRSGEANSSVYPLRAASREATSSRGASPGESTSHNVPRRSSLAFVALRGGRPRRDQRFVPSLRRGGEEECEGTRASRLVPGVEAAASGAHDRRAARVGPRLRRASPAP